jgi:hypothetical protein
LRKRKREVER